MKALVITNSITRRDEQSIEQYLKDIARFDVLTPEAEEALFMRYKNGDRRAFELILNHNLRFVVSVAKQYQNNGLALNDLINEGNLGLIKAAERFDPSRGFKFISYAVWWIRQRIIQALNEKARKIRLPLNQQSQFQKVKQCEERLFQLYNRKPSPHEIAEELDLEAKDVQRILKTSQFSQSLDAPSTTGEDLDMKSYLADDNVPRPDKQLAEDESLKIEIQQILSVLSSREKQVITMSFGLDDFDAMKLEDIGEFMGITRERVRQIRNKAVRKIKSYIRNHDMTFSFN